MRVKGGWDIPVRMGFSSQLGWVECVRKRRRLPFLVASIVYNEQRLLNFGMEPSIVLVELTGVIVPRYSCMNCPEMTALVE